MAGEVMGRGRLVLNFMATPQSGLMIHMQRTFIPYPRRLATTWIVEGTTKQSHHHRVQADDQ